MNCTPSFSRLCGPLLFVLLLLLCEIEGLGEVIWAVNCGGESHTDINGIRYQKDSHKLGIPSDFGKSLLIQRVSQQDQILYQTERYHVQNFAYEVPIAKEGSYVLVLKFSEVWFTQPDQKVISRWWWLTRYCNFSMGAKHLQSLYTTAVIHNYTLCAVSLH